MSNKAYYFVKNFNFQEVMNLLRYATKHPENLTNMQKTTRLYRSSLRKIHAHKLEGYKPCFKDYNDSLFQAREDFELALSLPADSMQRQMIMEKYEKYQEEFYDPNLIIDESRPYAAAAGRYNAWPDELLDFDPFGYYKPKLAINRQPSENIPFHEDYPMNDTHWNYYETFSENFDDNDYEAMQINKYSK